MKGELVGINEAKKFYDFFPETNCGRYWIRYPNC